MANSFLKDIMTSLMLLLSFPISPPGSLEEAGIKVWVDEVGLKAGVEFFNKIGQAIVDAKVKIYISIHFVLHSNHCSCGQNVY